MCHWINGWKYLKQECIPIGCVPSAAVARCLSGGGVSAQEVICPEGVSAQECVCPGGVSVKRVSAHGAGVCPEGVRPWLCLPRSVSAQEGCLSSRVSAQVGCVCLGDVCLGGCLSRGCLPDTTHPLWTEWQKCGKTLPCRNYVAGGSY